MSDSFNMPLCRSEFLQDFTIHLGVKLGSRYRWGGFTAVVDTCEHEGEDLERFSTSIYTPYRTRAHLVVWEDKTIWISAAHVPESGEKFQVGFYPDFESLGSERIIEAFLKTVSISTRLCYDESPESLMRQIWRYDGKVDTEGVI